MLPLLSVWDHHEKLSWHSLKSHRDIISPSLLRHDKRMQTSDTSNKDIYRCLTCQLCISTQAPKGTRTWTVIENAFWPSVGHCQRNSWFKWRITKDYTSLQDNAKVLTVLEKTITSVPVMADITSRAVEIWGQSGCCDSFPKPLPEFHLERAHLLVVTAERPRAFWTAAHNPWNLSGASGNCLVSAHPLCSSHSHIFSIPLILDSFSYSPELGCHIVDPFCSCFFIKVFLLSIKRPSFEQGHWGGSNLYQVYLTGSILPYFCYS